MVIFHKNKTWTLGRSGGMIPYEMYWIILKSLLLPRWRFSMKVERGWVCDTTAVSPKIVDRNRRYLPASEAKLASLFKAFSGVYTYCIILGATNILRHSHQRDELENKGWTTCISPLLESLWSACSVVSNSVLIRFRENQTIYDMIKPYTTHNQAKVKIILIYIKDCNLSLTQFKGFAQH